MRREGAAQPQFEPPRLADLPQPAARQPRDMPGLGGRNLAARYRGEGFAQHAPHILRRAQRREIGSRRRRERRQKAQRQRPEEKGLALDEADQRLGIEPAEEPLDRRAPRIADAGRPAARVAGGALREAPARAARARRKKIRSKWLRFLDSGSKNR